MKLILILLISLTLLGCPDEPPMKQFYVDGVSYHLVEIDGCEYLQGVYVLTHKGNCKFCAERKLNENR